MNRKLRLPLALALALGSSHALALGLGQIEVKSSLYQPLDAQIPVLSNTPSETANLKVRLASPEDFARVGLDSSSMLSANLEFSVQKDASGKSVIHVTTDSKLNDPFVTFLLEVDWGKGRMLREFTVLLDPPDAAKVTREEIFGPVACVYSYDNPDNAIRRANDSPFAFQAAVFTQEIDNAMYIADRLHAAAVMVNDHTAFRVDWMPFGGRKLSGLGVGGINYAMRDMCQDKLVVVKELRPMA